MCLNRNGAISRNSGRLTVRETLKRRFCVAPRLRMTLSEPAMSLWDLFVTVSTPPRAVRSIVRTFWSDSSSRRPPTILQACQP